MTLTCDNNEVMLLKAMNSIKLVVKKYLKELIQVVLHKVKRRAPRSDPWKLQSLS